MITNELHLVDITMRNFLSYGNADVTISLDNPGTTLIMGKDLDTGNGTANGVGKTTILRAVVYALFDDPMDKDTKLDELINNVNKKNMLVAIRFTKGGDTYRVVRQRKGKDGNTVHLYKNDGLITLDSVDNTNKYIAEKIIGYSMDLFVRIVVFSAGHGAFFSLPTSGAKKPTQSDIIEELFDLTSLTEKANLAKAEIKQNEQRMEVIKAKIEQIEKEKTRHAAQVTSTEERIESWEVARDVKVADLKKELKKIEGINFDKEQQQHKELSTKFAELKELNSTKTRAIEWKKSQDEKTSSIKVKLGKLDGINFDDQIQLCTAYDNVISSTADINDKLKKTVEWEDTRQGKIARFNRDLDKIGDINFADEEQTLNEIDTHIKTLGSLNTIVKGLRKVKGDSEQQIDSLTKESKHLFDATCPYCLQHFDGAESKIAVIQKQLTELQTEIDDTVTELTLTLASITTTQADLQVASARSKVASLAELAKFKSDREGLTERLADATNETNPHIAALALAAEVAEDELTSRSGMFPVQQRLMGLEVLSASLKKKITSESSVKELEQMKADQVALQQRLETIQQESNPFIEFLEEMLDRKFRPSTDIADACDTKLDELADAIGAIESSITVDDLETLLDMKTNSVTYAERLKEIEAETNPYSATLRELKAMDLDEAEYTAINEYTTLVEHQKFLVKLLTKSDSFVRKALIEENIPFLNKRLKMYLSELGLPHKVEFTNTMTAAISTLGRELRFNMLSTGQQARVNLALSWAFRDVLQNMHGKVNFCLLDEVLDVGLCPIGIGAAIRMLRNRAKAEKMTMFVISHRDEVDGAFDRTMRVEMKNGFSRIAE